MYTATGASPANLVVQLVEHVLRLEAAVQQQLVLELVLLLLAKLLFLLRLDDLFHRDLGEAGLVLQLVILSHATAASIPCEPPHANRHCQGGGSPHCCKIHIARMGTRGTAERSRTHHLAEENDVFASNEVNASLDVAILLPDVDALDGILQDQVGWHTAEP